jgi:DNA replication protein DnaC
MTNSQPGPSNPFAVEMIDVVVDCDTHGAQTVQRVRSIGGEVFAITRAPKCPVCSKEAAERAEAERKEAERQERIERLIASAGIHRRYEGTTFADFNAAQPNQQRALEIVRKYADAVASKQHSGDWLVLSGLPGTGKTLLESAMCRYLAERGVPVLYITQSDMARDFRRSYQRDAQMSEPALFDLLSTKGVLVIDEIGSSTSEHVERLLFEICDARYADQRPTVFATNHPRRDLAAIIGERLYDRMCEVATFVSFDWPSSRTAVRRAHTGQPNTTQRVA